MDDLEVLRKILLSDDISVYEDVIFKIIPLLKYEKGFDQKNSWHIFDVWNHTLTAIQSCDKNFYDRLILLLHDIGKPFSYQDDGESRHFRGHALKSKELSFPILKKLGIEEKEINDILFIIENHSRNIKEIDFNNNEELYNRLLKIQMCDASAYEYNHSKMILERLKCIKRDNL